ncbi:MAG TPA: hypothetical protein VN673_14425, partial [Clostridia bacterium]|nr:hypothetical protein [Clostridia bacterium]
MIVPVVLSVSGFLCLATAACAAAGAEPHAYPAPMPRDISFETVVSTEGYPAFGYAVPVVGWKHHPEEIHVT